MIAPSGTESDIAVSVRQLGMHPNIVRQHCSVTYRSLIVTPHCRGVATGFFSHFADYLTSPGLPALEGYRCCCAVPGSYDHMIDAAVGYYCYSLLIGTAVTWC